MSRHSPTVLLSTTNRKTHKCEEVLVASMIYSVFYAGSPINLRESHSLRDGFNKYKKVSFSAPGNALRLCKRLNKLYHTTDFEVYQMVGATKVEQTIGRPKRTIGRPRKNQSSGNP